MKNLFLVGSFLFICNISSFAQNLFSISSIDSSLSYFVNEVKDVNWDYYNPVFGIVINCTNSDSVFWSVSNLKNNYEYEWFKPDYYYVYDSYYVLLKHRNCENFIYKKKEVFSEIDSVMESKLINALYPESVQINRVMNTFVFYATKDELIIFKDDYCDSIPGKLQSIYPFYNP